MSVKVTETLRVFDKGCFLRFLVRNRSLVCALLPMTTNLQKAQIKILFCFCCCFVQVKVERYAPFAAYIVTENSNLENLT